MRGLEDQAFEFGNFVLVPGERLLMHAGAPVPLTGKAFELLAVLLRRSGHLVTKDELFAEVWPNTFVQETSPPQRRVHDRRSPDGREAAERSIEGSSRPGGRCT
jgi:DNA-binding winged helix-turn-helix (wHTH) protein